MMGTNYYTTEGEPCKECGRCSEPLHIGKSSAGWKFLFAPYPGLGLTSWRAWRKFLAAPGTVIKDEYGAKITFAEFVAKVEAKQTPDAIDASSATQEQWGGSSEDRSRYERADDEGYRFSTTDDFS